MKINNAYKNIFTCLVLSFVLLTSGTFLAYAQYQTDEQISADQTDIEAETDAIAETAVKTEAETELETELETEAETELETKVSDDEKNEIGETDCSAQNKEEETMDTSDRQAQDENSRLIAESQSEEDSEDNYGLFMTELDESTVMVSSYQELADALSNDNGYTYIYLSGDITQGSANSGIRIHPSKPSVVIDGTPPGYTPATFTQRGSSDIANTIRVISSNTVTRDICLRNMNIIGRNFYGVVSISAANVDITYENINYTGPQITYNRNGSAHYINSTINIISAVSSGGSAAQEVAEAAQIIFSGSVNITSASTGNSMFWLTGSSTSMTLNPGAQVEANARSYFIYADASYPDMSIQNGAGLNYQGKNNGLLLGAQGLKSLHLYENAELYLNQTASNFAYGTLRITTSLQADRGSTLYIDRSSGGPAIQFINAGANASFYEPERVMLYAPSKQLINYVSTGSLDITSGAVNIWATAGGFVNDSLDNTPSYHWNRGSGEILEIHSTFIVTSQTLSTNLNSGDPTSNLTGSTFAVGNSKMLVFGRIGLEVDPVYVNSEVISGTTEQSASLRVQNLSQSSVLAAEGSAFWGAYALTILNSLEIDDNLLVLTYDNYLRMVQHTTVQEAEPESILQFEYVPAALDFSRVCIPDAPCIIPRSDNSAFYIEIKDTRDSASNWMVLASIDTPLSSQEGDTVYTLNNGLVFIDSENNSTVLSSSQTQILSGNGDKTVGWEENQGILLWADPSQIRSEVTYMTTIHWSLQDAP